jgi:AcrR family transcriptional regulator
MSGKTTIKPATTRSSRKVGSAKADRRSVHTRNALGDALIELMQRQSFDSITVQQVLDRAGISRSTFYTHYRDKDDLFLSDVEDFLQLMSTLLTRHGAPLTRVAPVAELFAHIAEMQSLSDAINASGKGPDVRELGIGYFARSIEQRLTMAGVALPTTELRAAAHALAGTMFSLLDWWLRSGKPIPPREVDAIFHRIVWTGIRRQNGREP